jgi:hypothetical protein
MINRRALLALVPLLALAAGCTKDRATFAPAWKAAVQAKDGRAALALLDRAARDKIVSGLKKSQDKAAKDPAFKKLFVAANAPEDTTRAPEDLAAALIASQMGEGKADLGDDGKAAQIHLEDGNWRVAAEPVGFVDPDGAPLTLRLRLPGAPEREIPPGKPTYTVHVQWEGKTPAEVHDAYSKAVARIGEIAHFQDGWAAGADRLVNAYWEIEAKALDHEYKVDLDGSITPVMTYFDDKTLSQKKQPRDKLSFGAWR